MDRADPGRQYHWRDYVQARAELVGMCTAWEDGFTVADAGDAVAESLSVARSMFIESRADVA